MYINYTQHKINTVKLLQVMDSVRRSALKKYTTAIKLTNFCKERLTSCYFQKTMLTIVLPLKLCF